MPSFVPTPCALPGVMSILKLSLQVVGKVESVSFWDDWERGVTLSA